MTDYIVDYVVTSVRSVRIIANTPEDAEREVKQYHQQMESEMIKEAVIILMTEEDK